MALNKVFRGISKRFPLSPPSTLDSFITVNGVTEFLYDPGAAKRFETWEGREERGSSHNELSV